MRRHEREIKDKQEIEGIIQQAQICRIGLSKNDEAYIVPVNFGYESNCLYFHCASEGRKLEMVRQNNRVCFEMDIDYQMLKQAGRPCEWGARYRSVMGTGKAIIVENPQEKAKALNAIIRHYGADDYDFSESETKTVTIVKIEISSMTGKKAGY